MKVYKTLFDELSILSEKHNCPVNVSTKIINGELTFYDIEIIYTEENKTEDILDDLDAILIYINDITSTNEETGIFITLLLDDGETLKVAAMIGNQ